MANKILEIPEEFQGRFDELVEIETKLYDLKRDQEIKTASLWKEVEIKFNVRGKVLRYVKDKNHIEVIEIPQEIEDKEMLQLIRQGKAQPSAQHKAGVTDIPNGSALPKVVLKNPSIWQKIKNSFK